MTDYRPIVTDEEWGNHQRALFRVTVDNYESALSEDPLGLQGMRERLQPLDVPEAVSRRQDAERGEITGLASELGASFLPVDDAPDLSTISEPLPKGPSFAEFMAAHEGPKGIDFMAPDAPPEEGPANLNPVLSALDRGGKAIGGAIKGVLEPVGRLPGEIAEFSRMATTPYVDETGRRRPWSEAPTEAQYGRAEEAAGTTTAVAGDLAQVYPPWAAGNAQFNAARGAITGSGLVPEDSPIADAAALVTQVGGPSALRAAQRAVVPELDNALAALPKYGAQAAKAVDDFGRQFPALESGQVNPGVIIETADEALERVGQMLTAGKPPRVPSTGIEEAAGGLATRIASFWDQGAPLRRVQEEVYRRLGRTPTVEEDAALQLRLYAGRAAAAGAKVEDELLPAIKNLNTTERQALEEYLVLADNADKAAAIGNRAGAAAGAADTRLFSGDVHAHELPQVQHALWNKYGGEVTQKVMGAADDVWKYTQSLRDRLHDAGVISDEVHDAWTRDFPHYAKTDILKYMDDAESAARVPTGRPVLTVSDLKIGRLTEEGTKEARDRPLNSIIRQTFATESLARRNEAAQALLKMRNADPELAALLKPVKGEHSLAAGERYFSVYVDGQQQRFVGPKELEGLYRINPPEIPQWVRLASTLSGAPLLRAGATGVNLGFILPNALRDAQEIVRRAGGFSGLGKFRTSASALGRAYVDTFSRERIPDWQEALRAGAGQSSEYSGLAPDQIVRRLTKEGKLGGRVRPVTSKKDLAGAMGDVLGIPFEPIRALGQKIEQAPRLASYRLAKQQGEPIERAALAARDITMDFARGGTAAKVANTFIPFFNAGAQGLERFATYDLAKGRRLQTGIGLVTSVVLPTMAAEAWNRSQYPEDWADVPDYLKDTGFVMLLPIESTPNTDGSRGQRPYIWIPRPQSTNFVSALTARTMEQAYGDDSRQWGDLLESIVGMASPVGLESVPLPPAARTGMELLTNKDLFRDREIVPEQVQNLPPGEQARPETSAFGRGVGRLINKPPAAVDYAVTSMAGGVGRQALRTSDALARVFGLPAAEPARTAPVLDVPVAGDVVGSVVRNRGGQTVTDRMDELKREEESERDEIIARLEASPSWANLTPAQQRERKLTRLNALERKYQDRRRVARKQLAK